MSGFPDWPNPMRSGAMQCAIGATKGMTFRHRYDEVGFPCRKSATCASGFPASRRPWWNPEHSPAAVQHHKGPSFLLSLNVVWKTMFLSEHSGIHSAIHGEI